MNTCHDPSTNVLKSKNTNYDVVVLYATVYHSQTEHKVMVVSSSCSDGIDTIPYGTDLAPKLKELQDAGFVIIQCFPSQEGEHFILIREHK